MNKNRKVIISIGCILIGLVLSLVKGDIPNNFLQLLLFVCGSHHIMNGVEHVAGIFKKD